MERIQEAISRIEHTIKFKKTSLSLNSLGLTKIPDLLYKLKDQLVNLDLMDNNLTKLPTYILEFKNLKNLHLSYNSFTQFPVSTLSLKNIDHICLRYNEIEYLPKELININRYLDIQLDHNKIKYFPINLNNAENLLPISLSDNPIENIPKDKIDNEIDLLIYLYEKEKGDKFKFPIQPKLRTAFKQYLIHFNEFVEQTKGKKIHFEIRNYEEGLELEIKTHNDSELLNIEKYLEEYVNFIKQNHEDLKINYELNVSRTEGELIKLQLKNEVLQFKMKYEFAEFKTKHLEKQVNELNEALTLALQQPLNLQINQNSYIQSNTTPENLKTELNSLKSSLEELLIKKLNDDEKIELLEIQNELTNIKNSKDENEIKKSSIWERTKQLTGKILKRSELLGKGVKGIRETIESSQVITKQIDYILELLNNIT